MQRLILLLAAGLCVSAWANEVPEAQESDSLNLRRLQEASITSTRARETTPVAFKNIDKVEIQEHNMGKDLPAMLWGEVSTLQTSDAGMGVGYSSLNIRGTDQTRINVTLDGIPLNDAESNGLYWVNMPDVASSVSSVQITRGVGTSTNGSGAFGANVSLLTDRLSQNPYARVDFCAGSYGTHKETLQFGTGLLRDHWAVQGTLSDMGSDGYIDHAQTRQWSYFLQGGYFAENTVVKFFTLNGKEKTYHAWDYATRDQMEEYGRTYNPCGLYERDGVEYRYDDQTDNYHQQHYALTWQQQWGAGWSSQLSLHYTHGYGYYEQYKEDQSLYKYDFSSEVGDYSDLVRRKVMDNDLYGTVFSLNYKQKRLKAAVGGGWNQYDGDHYGEVIWMEQAAAEWDPNHRYYDNTGRKRDFNIYGKADYGFTRTLSGFLDLQYRYVDYKMYGPSDQYSSGEQVVYDERHYFNFFNPKAGINWKPLDGHRAYFSVGITHKEPTRNDYEDNVGGSEPKAERLTDFELGYEFHTRNFRAGINFYLMLYRDQFVLTGEQNEIGEMIARNMGDSYRRGVELQAAWTPLRYFTWEANLTWSHNRAQDLHVWLDDTGEDYVIESAPLTYSPSLLLNNTFRFDYKGFSAKLSTQFVDHQYMTTTGLRSYTDGDQEVSLMLDSYCTTNLDLSYRMENILGVKAVTLGCTIYNLFSAEYESYGAAYTALKSDGNGGYMGYQDDYWSSYSVYSAQAPIHFMARLSIDL